MSKFYCVDCVISGHFIHSRSNLFETFSEKSMRLFALNSENNKTKTEIEEKINCALKRENIKEDIKLFKIKLRYIKRAIKKNTI